MLLLLLSHCSRVWLCDPIDGSSPGSPVPGILQARTLEWVAISFSNAWKWKVKVKSLSRVRLRDPMDCSLPGSSLHGILQARVLEWVAISFSWASSWPRDWTWISRIPGRCFNLWATREALVTALETCHTLRMPRLLHHGLMFGQPCVCISSSHKHHIFHTSKLKLGEGNDTPRQYFVWKIPCMEEPGMLKSMGSLRVGHDWVTSLSLFTSCIEEGNGNPLQYSCLENPRDGGAWWLPSMGPHRVGHDSSD